MFLTSAVVRSSARPCVGPRVGPRRVGLGNTNVAPQRGQSVVVRQNFGARDLLSSAEDLVDKHIPSLRRQPKSQGTAPSKRDTGVFLLLGVNVVIYLLDHVLQQPWVSSLLYLHGNRPYWWAFATNAFCHVNWQHLSSNMFFLYVFGKEIEQSEGAVAVWLSYLICALGGSFAAFMYTPHKHMTAFLGASGAVFGLCAISVLLSLRFELRSMLRICAIGPFVWHQIAGEVRAQMAGSGKMVAAGLSVSHMAHLGGVLAGVALISLLFLIPEPKS